MPKGNNIANVTAEKDVQVVGQKWQLQKALCTYHAEQKIPHCRVYLRLNIFTRTTSIHITGCRLRGCELSLAVFRVESAAQRISS